MVGRVRRANLGNGHELFQLVKCFANVRVSFHSQRQLALYEWKRELSVKLAGLESLDDPFRVRAVSNNGSVQWAPGE